MGPVIAISDPRASVRPTSGAAARSPELWRFAKGREPCEVPRRLRRLDRGGWVVVTRKRSFVVEVAGVEPANGQRRYPFVWLISAGQRLFLLVQECPLLTGKNRDSVSRCVIRVSRDSGRRCQGQPLLGACRRSERSALIGVSARSTCRNRTAGSAGSSTRRLRQNSDR